MVYARLSANGAAVEYGTYLGGAEPAGATPGTPSIIVTPGRDVYLLIEEGGTGAPTTSGAYRPNNSGGDDFIIAHFSPTDQLVYATYLGGSGDEELETHNLVVDGAGRAIVASVTDSRNYPVTQQAYQTQYGGGARDAVVSILSADGAGLVASTYLGGSGIEDVQGVKIGQDGAIYFSGGSASPNLRTTPNAYQSWNAGGMDAFAAALSSDLKTATFLTYVGGSTEDIARALDVAGDGSIAIGGHTASPNFPVSGGGVTAPNGPYTGWWALLTP
jgi:hypothetical protein